MLVLNLYDGIVCKYFAKFYNLKFQSWLLSLAKLLEYVQSYSSEGVNGLDHFMNRSYS